jgi:hypothetical protein
MTEKKRDKDLDALKADIARLRDEISGLIAGPRAASEAKMAENRAGKEHDASERQGPAESGQDHDPWTDLFSTFETSKAKGEQVLKNLASEVEQHPMVSIVAAFGLGYLVAKLWHQGDKQ